jgi:hypothetical protein
MAKRKVGGLCEAYHRARSGDEIQTVDTIIGKLVSVFLVRTVDGGSTSFNVANIVTEHRILVFTARWHP